MHPKAKMVSQPTYSHVATHAEDDEIPIVKGVEIKNNSRNSVHSTGLIGHPAVNDVESLNTGTYVAKMIAPATLPEGYEIPVQLGSSQFNIQIPKGGVIQGQEFNVTIPQGTVSSSTHGTVSRLPPVGVWSDNICDCCSYGLCHPHCLTSTCCPLCK
jgi:hypothetical protein